ncbi:MAG: phosphoribosylamine--glycine ligase, partial [Firmicutes bacterium]|nr:phosphoribosylamine--glycine ligase [Bacillota bacterium]
PESYEKGFEITVDESVEPYVYMAGAKLDPKGTLVTNGGRVLGVTAVANSLEAAIDMAYARASGVRFENKYMRTDIGARALDAAK